MGRTREPVQKQLPDEAVPAVYCRRCGYQLVGLPENRCPECRRIFHPVDETTCSL